jgi:hypothetical protein
MSLNLNSDPLESLWNIWQFPLELLQRLKSLTLLGQLVIYRNIFEEWVQHLCEIFCKLLNTSFSTHPVEVNFTSLCLNFLGHIISPFSMSTNWERATVICKFKLLMKVVTRLVNMVDIFSVSKSGTSPDVQGKKNASSIWTQNKVSFRPWIWSCNSHTGVVQDSSFLG